MALDGTSEGPLKAFEDHAYCELGGEGVVLHLGTGIYYGLDVVGTRVWGLLQQPRSVAELRDLIVDEFDVVPDRCESDLRPFLASLQSHGLVRAGNGLDQ